MSVMIGPLLKKIVSGWENNWDCRLSQSGGGRYMDGEECRLSPARGAVKPMAVFPYKRESFVLY